MDVWMIWAKVGDSLAGTSGNEVWLIEAWDSDSVDGNPEGWAEVKEKAYAEHGGERVVINKTSVNFESVINQFNVPVSV